jgi:hypothetical protein
MFLYSKNGRILLTTSDRWSSYISENAAEAAEVFVEARVLHADRVGHLLLQCACSNIPLTDCNSGTTQNCHLALILQLSSKT